MNTTAPYRPKEDFWDDYFFSQALDYDFMVHIERILASHVRYVLVDMTQAHTFPFVILG
jgi:hypothetical protein